MKEKNIVATWSVKKIQEDIKTLIFADPLAHPSAFVSVKTPEPLCEAFRKSKSKEEFMANVMTDQEVYSLLHDWVETWAEIENDVIEFARIDLENDINLEIFTGPRTFGGKFFVTKANKGGMDVHFIFEAKTATQILESLAPIATDISFFKMPVAGLYCLKADDDYFVIEDFNLKIQREMQDHQWPINFGIAWGTPRFEEKLKKALIEYFGGGYHA